MRIPVVDIRGVPLQPCTAPKARVLIKKGKAVPRRTDQGAFYIQLTYEQEDHTPLHKRRKSFPVPQRRVHRSKRTRQADQVRTMLDVLSTGCQPDEDAVAKKLDFLLVIDVESTCWDGPPPANQESEIIEVGVCLLDIASGDRVDRRSILVRPEFSRVSPFCTELTTLTQEQVDQGVTFAEACATLRRDYASHERIWASYGDYDRRQFEKQCLMRTVDYPFGPSHVNVKNVLALVHSLKTEIGLLSALDLMHLPLDGVHHRGVDDAWNTGLLLSKLIWQRRVELGVIES